MKRWFRVYLKFDRWRVFGPDYKTREQADKAAEALRADWPGHDCTVREVHAPRQRLRIAVR
jgi:hypothetical protein